MAGRWNPGRAAYRARQFLRGLRPALAPSEVAEARRRLSPAEFALFAAADARDRRHACDLFAALRAEGAGEAALTAALLHDVGKGPLSVWHRVAFVLLDAASPALARRLEAEERADWRGALWRLRHHARVGAARLSDAGSATRVVDLVARHTEPPPTDDAELARFVALDDRV